MYTELSIGIRLKVNTPKEIIDILQKMLTADEEFLTNIIHPLFKTDRWWWMLQSSGSYYFHRQTNTIFKFDKIINSYFLSFTTNIKNYGSEFEHFLDFISPYIDTKGYIGTYQYEEMEEPYLLYNINGKIYFKDPSLIPDFTIFDTTLR